jgi:hypothetical protein
MTDGSYIYASLLWAVYGLVVGFGLGTVARLMWMTLSRKQ